MIHSKKKYIIVIKFSYGGLKRLLPGEFFVNRVFATGYQIWQSLENGVSRYPALEGRFPMVNKYSYQKYLIYSTKIIYIINRFYYYILNQVIKKIINNYEY